MEQDEDLKVTMTCTVRFGRDRTKNSRVVAKAMEWGFEPAAVTGESMVLIHPDPIVFDGGQPQGVVTRSAPQLVERTKELTKEPPEEQRTIERRKKPRRQEKDEPTTEAGAICEACWKFKANTKCEPCSKRLCGFCARRLKGLCKECSERPEA